MSTMERRFGLEGKGLLFLSVFWFFWFTNMIVRLSFAPVLPLIEDEFLVTHAQAGSIFIFQSIGYALAMFFSGLYAGRFGYKKSIVLSLAATSLLLFLIPFVKAFPLLYVFSFMTGASIGVYLPAVLPLITEYFAEGYWARAIAIHDSGAPAGIFCCPLIALFFLQFFGWRGTFQVFAVVVLVNAVMCCFIGHEVKVVRSEKNAFGDLFRMRSLWIMTILFILATGANLGIFGIMPLYLTKELSLSIGYANHVVGLSRLGAIGVAVSVTFFVHRIDLIKALFVILLVAGILTVLHRFSSRRIYRHSSLFSGGGDNGIFPFGIRVGGEDIPQGNEKPGNRRRRGPRHPVRRRRSPLPARSFRRSRELQARYFDARAGGLPVKPSGLCLKRARATERTRSSPPASARPSSV